MEINKLFMHPYVRLLFLINCTTGTFFINKTYLLLIFYLLLILPLFILSAQFKKHFKLILFGIFPIYLSFILLYIVVLKSSKGDWDFIHLKMLKLILLTSIVQLTLSIPSENLIPTFKMWRLKGESLITILGSFTVWADVNYRAEKIITARFSRGFIRKRTIFNKAKQFPFILVPLVIGILRTSIERAESWEQKNILQLVEANKLEKINYPILSNGLLLVISLFWLIIGFLNN